MLALALALLAATAASPPPGPPADSTLLQQGGRDFDAPPPGSPEDRALWRTAHALNTGVPVARSVAAKLQFRAQAHEERLEALAKRGGDDARRAAAVRARLDPAWQASLAVVRGQTPIDPTRVCGYPLLTFDSAMLAGEGPSQRAQLADARRDLQRCVSGAEATLAELNRTNQALGAIVAELDRDLQAPRAEAAGREASAR